MPFRKIQEEPAWSLVPEVTTRWFPTLSLVSKFFVWEKCPLHEGHHVVIRKCDYEELDDFIQKHWKEHYQSTPPSCYSVNKEDRVKEIDLGEEKNRSTLIVQNTFFSVIDDVVCENCTVTSANHQNPRRRACNKTLCTQCNPEDVPGRAPTIMLSAEDRTMEITDHHEGWEAMNSFREMNDLEGVLQVYSSMKASNVEVKDDHITLIIQTCGQLAKKGDSDQYLETGIYFFKDFQQRQRPQRTSDV